MLGWTFATDFWNSKTTHLAISSVLGAIAAVATHQVAPFPALVVALGTVAVAFLRDTHAKGAELGADLLEELIEAVHGHEADGEADAPVPVVPPTPPLTQSNTTIFPAIPNITSGAAAGGSV